MAPNTQSAEGLEENKVEAEKITEYKESGEEDYGGYLITSPSSSSSDDDDVFVAFVKGLPSAIDDQKYIPDDQSKKKIVMTCLGIMYLMKQDLECEKIVTEFNEIEKERETEKEREIEKEHEREPEKERKRKTLKESDTEKERERETEKERDTEKERNTDKKRDTKKEKETEKEKERETEKERELEKWQEKETEKERERETEKERERKTKKVRDTEKERDTDKKRDTKKEKETEKEKERETEKERDTDKERDTEKERERETLKDKCKKSNSYMNYIYEYLFRVYLEGHYSRLAFYLSAAVKPEFTETSAENGENKEQQITLGEALRALGGIYSFYYDEKTSKYFEYNWHPIMANLLLKNVDKLAKLFKRPSKRFGQNARNPRENVGNSKSF